jgi:YD repeat-containing protein
MKRTLISCLTGLLVLFSSTSHSIGQLTKYWGNTIITGNPVPATLVLTREQARLQAFNGFNGGGQDCPPAFRVLQAGDGSFKNFTDYGLVLKRDEKYVCGTLTYHFGPVYCHDSVPFWNPNATLGNQICLAQSPLNPLRNTGDPDKSCPSPAFGSNPINGKTGNKFQKETDYQSALEGGLVFERFYNSDAAVQTGTIGNGWRTTFDRRLELSTVGGVQQARVWREDGSAEDFFNFDISGWQPSPDIVAKLVGDATNGWTYTAPNDTQEVFDATGRLVSITTRTGFAQTLEYNLATTAGGDGIPTTLDRVTGPFGRQLTFTWQDRGAGIYFVASVTMPNGTTMSYSYSPTGNLQSVTYPGSGATTTRNYLYTNTSFPRALTGITDENNAPYATWSYDATGRAIESKHGGTLNADRYTFAFSTTNTVITDPLTRARTASWSIKHGVAKVASMTNGPCTSCGASIQSVTYDANGNAATKTDFNGNQTAYTYDLTRNLELTRTEGLSNTGAIQLESRRTTTTWHASFRLPTTITIAKRDAGNTSWLDVKRTSYGYDTAGRMLTKTETALDVIPNVSRTWTYTWNTTAPLTGLVATMDGPRTDVTDITTYTYYTDTTATHKPGDLWKVTNALNQVTTITAYDGNGRPLSVSDPNGAITNLTYHPRGWLTSRQVAGQTTTFTYDNVGQLDRMTLPTGAFLDYDYDDAHRLIRIKDNLSNKMEYTLDLMGNHTAEKVYDPAGVLKRQSTAVFNTLNQLEQQIGGTGNTTRFTYDANGNQKRTIDPRDPAPATPTIFSENLYDALNRVRQTKDNLGGNTTTTYDVLDNPKTVTDPRGLVTSYTYNAFGEMTQQINPDSGTTNYQYDTAGNQISKTDARNITVTTTYDALNRQTLINYPSDIDTSFVYDEMATGGPGAKGRLTTMVDESGTTKFQYDVRGNLIRLDVVIANPPAAANPNYSLQFTYNGANQLSQITYPSGMIVDYQRDVAGYAVAATATTSGAPFTIVSNVQREPFGPIKALTLSNGSIETRTHDVDSRLTSVTSAGKQNQTFSYDAASNITAITDTLRPIHGGTFSIDYLNRIVGQTSAASNRSYTYDANGNRTQLQETSPNSFVESLGIAATSNRLSTLNATPINYLNSGQQLNDPAKSALFTYNEAGRLKATAVGQNTYNFLYNGRGQLAADSASYLVRNLYVYDQAGRILSVRGWFVSFSSYFYDEIVWLDDRPVALISNSRQFSGPLLAGTAHSIHVNHINRPLLMTGPTGAQTYLWQPVDAFGAGTTSVAFNPSFLKLGFPGQFRHAGAEDIWNNYFRSYNPRTGRYLETDPIGLDAALIRICMPMRIRCDTPINSGCSS